jgi:hypothetical protein
VDSQSWLKVICGTFDYPYEKLPKFVLCILVEGLNGGNYHCRGLYGPLALAAEYYELHEKTALEVGIPKDHVHFYLDPIYNFHGQLCYFELDISYDGSDMEFGEKLRFYNNMQIQRLLDLGIYLWLVQTLCRDNRADSSTNGVSCRGLEEVSCRF